MIMVSRAERLDPVRRPSRSTVWRLAAVATLLITAALLAWSGTPPCAG
jgi:hypothetical protein